MPVRRSNNSELEIEITKERKIDQDLLQQAEELAQDTEILPGGSDALALHLQLARAQGRPLRVKLGVDPTATDLHIGHAVVFHKLRRFQELGHQVVLIIGGFTAQIGDPSGRNSTRPPLTKEQVAQNAETWLEQIKLILNLEKIEIVNNADWLSSLTLSDLLKLASSVTVNQLLAKEAFGDRFEKQLPVSFHELFYPLLQGYDSVAIRSDIELGGTDQRFNILQGRALQPIYGLEPQLAMLLPLLEGTDGVKKMSKSYDNYIALKDKPADMFGKCMRIPDELIIKYFRLATIFDGKTIEAISVQLAQGANPKDLKLQLAAQIVRQYWGEDCARQEQKHWEQVHSKRQLPNKSEMPIHIVKPGTPLFRIILEASLAASTSEAKRLVKEGAVQYCGKVTVDPSLTLSPNSSFSDEGPLQVGRRKFVWLRHE